MKRILFILCLIAQQAFATNHIVAITAGDNKTNVNNALSGLTDRDTITFPACSVYISHPRITINIKIKILGLDSSNTILYRNTSSSDANLLNEPFFEFVGTSWNYAPSGVQVKGIKFMSKVPSVDDAGADGKSIALDQALKFTNVSGFEVTQCAFWYFGNGAIYINHRDFFARGLIQKNGFVWNAKGATGLGYGYGVVIYGENLQWMAYKNHTDGNMIYIDGNNYKYQSHAIAAGGCAVYESRYNMIRENIISANPSKHAIDGHGQEGEGGALGSQNYYSTRLMVSYYDSIINTKFFDRSAYVSNGTHSVDEPMERLYMSRGAPIRAHHLYLYGGRFGFGIGVDGDPHAYPYWLSMGYASGLTYPSTHSGTTVSQREDDSAIWSNTYVVFDGSDGDGTGFHNYETGIYTSGRDYLYSTNGSAAPDNWVDLPYPCVHHY